MKNYFIYFNQILITIYSHIWMKFYNLEVISENFIINKGKKYILVANHFSKKDPFIITPFLPWNARFVIIPYRFLVTKDYMKGVLMRIFLYLCGCFFNMAGKETLKTAQGFLNRGETIFIFPEGKMNKTGKFDKSIKLGVGAVYLERNNPDLYLIPVKIEYLGKRKIKLTYKKPFRHKKFPKDLYPLMEKTMKGIYKSKSP